MNLRGIYAEPFFHLLFEHLLSSSRFMTKKKWTRITTHEFFHNVAVWKTLFMLKAQEYSSFQCWQYWIQWRNVRSCPIEINWIKPERSAVRELTLTNAYKRIFFFKLFCWIVCERRIYNILCAVMLSWWRRQLCQSGRAEIIMMVNVDFDADFENRICRRMMFTNLYEILR